MNAVEHALQTVRGRFVGDEAGWRDLFAAIDARDAQAFAGYLTPDARFRFGNAPEVAGREQIARVVENFFGLLAACRHELLASWTGPASAVGEGRVTYTVGSGAVISVPFVNVFGLRDGLIEDYRIYIDNGPLLAAL